MQSTVLDFQQVYAFQSAFALASERSADIAIEAEGGTVSIRVRSRERTIQSIRPLDIRA